MIYTHITNGAVVARFHVILAVVARVDEFVGALIVQFVQHAERTELGTPQR